MFSLIKQLFIVLSSFSKSLAHDHTIFLKNGRSCKVRPTFIDFNTVELNIIYS